MHFDEENTIIASEVFLSVKTLKSVKDAGCAKILYDMPKALKGEEVIWLTVHVKRHGILEKHQKVGKWGDHPHTQEGRQVKSISHRGISHLVLRGKCMPTAWIKDELE